MASADQDKLGADLSAYLDGELSPERTREIERLLADSPEARRDLGELRKISEGLAALPRARAPRHLPRTFSAAAARQVSLQSRSQVRRARALGIFARVVASAALVTIGVFAGWTIRPQSAPPVPSAAGREIVSDGTGIARRRPVETLEKRGAAQESAPVVTADADAGELQSDAPAVAMAETRRGGGPGRAKKLDHLGRSGGRGARAAPLSETPPPASERAAAASNTALPAGKASTIEAGAPASAAIPAVDVSPAIRLVVASRDRDEYAANLRTIALWQKSSPIVAAETAGESIAEPRPLRNRRPKAAADSRRKREVVALRQQDFTLEVPPERFREVLRSFAERAPRRVQVVMNFDAQDIGHVQHLVQAGEAHAQSDESGRVAGLSPTPPDSLGMFVPAETPSQARGAAPADTEEYEATRFAARGAGRGRVARGSPRSSRGAPAEADENEQILAQRIAAPRDAEAADQARALGYADDSADHEDVATQAAIDLGKDWATQRRPLVSEVAAGVPMRAPPRRPLDRLDTATKGTPGSRGHLGDSLATSADRALGARAREIPPEPAPAAPVTLYVTLMPPPPPATTRPDTQPASSPRANGIR